MDSYCRCERERATERAPRDPFRLLERRHGLAETVERGVGVPVERLPVTSHHPERELMRRPENTPRRGYHFFQQRLGFSVAP